LPKNKSLRPLYPWIVWLLLAATLAFIGWLLWRAFRWRGVTAYGVVVLALLYSL